MGLFVSVFACKHVLIVTKGLTTKQLHSIKEFENEASKNNMKVEGLGIVKNQVKDFDLGQINFERYEDTIKEEEKDKTNISSSNSINKKYLKTIKLRDRFRNLLKFYMKTIPNSLV